MHIFARGMVACNESTEGVDSRLIEGGPKLASLPCTHAHSVVHAHRLQLDGRAVSAQLLMQIQCFSLTERSNWSQVCEPSDEGMAHGFALHLECPRNRL